MTKFKYILCITTFLCSIGILLLILNIITLKKIEIINAKIDKNFSFENIQGVSIIDTNGNPLGVVGEDDRIIIESSDSPYNAIGHLGIGYYRNNQWVIVSTMCTAILYHDYYIFSAAHCIQDTSNESNLGELKKNIVFLPNSIKRKSNDIVIISKLIRSTIFPKFGSGTRNLGNDWVILITLKTVNRKYYAPIVLSDNKQLLPYIGFDNNNQKSFISVMGYSADINNGESLSVHNGIEITNIDFMGALRSKNSDLNPGASGGPLIETIFNKGNNSIYYKLHGVVSGHSCPPNSFVGVNCYIISSNDPINIFAPINVAKEALIQYMLNNNLDNTEEKDILLNGPAPTNPPILTLTPTKSPEIQQPCPTTLTPTPTKSYCR